MEMRKGSVAAGAWITSAVAREHAIVSFAATLCMD
jgi:hypothetical protein